eukprot:TRINITY_DN12095_c0_g2_i3.p1 TRINITY_DN12095_c0_g2~~TRINITY_DN12095_c0_g2_i3.p1  ORF type:complete len:147 (+),score=31.80 TRINITY_DN12095_c0_g2_i3:106-546(+)
MGCNKSKQQAVVTEQRTRAPRGSAAETPAAAQRQNNNPTNPTTSPPESIPHHPDASATAPTEEMVPSSVDDERMLETDYFAEMMRTKGGDIVNNYATQVIDVRDTMSQPTSMCDVEGAEQWEDCLLYTSDAADEEDSVDLGGRRIL